MLFVIRIKHIQIFASFGPNLSLLYYFTDICFSEETDKELTTSEFFESDIPDSFFNPKTTKAPTLDEMAKYFFDVEEEEEFFHKDKDLFEKLEDDEKFFFKEEKPKVIPSKKCHCATLHCVCCTGFKIANYKQYTGTCNSSI